MELVSSLSVNRYKTARTNLILTLFFSIAELTTTVVNRMNWVNQLSNVFAESYVVGYKLPTKLRRLKRIK